MRRYPGTPPLVLLVGLVLVGAALLFIASAVGVGVAFIGTAFALGLERWA